MTDKKTVAERAQDKAVELAQAKKEMETSLAAPVSGQGIDGLEGLEAEDVNVPYMYLVRVGAEHAVCANGQKAKPGTYFHSSEKKAYEDPEVVIAYARKIKRDEFKDGERTGERETVWSVLVLMGEEMKPVKMTVSGYNMYTGWKDFTSKLIFEEIGSPYNVKVKLTSEEILMTKRNKNILVNKFEILESTTEEERAKARSIGMQLSGVLGDTQEPEMNAAVSALPVELPMNDLDEDDLDSLFAKEND